jgi:hypothetical protein
MKENIIVCPHCDHEFTYNKVNGIALIEATQNIEARKRMHSKLTLDALERLKIDNKVEYPLVRKVVLDALNDLARDIHTIMGFGTEVE